MNQSLMSLYTSFKSSGMEETIFVAAIWTVWSPRATFKSSCQITCSMFAMMEGRSLPRTLEYYTM
jgi:hypothetical protein